MNRLLMTGASGFIGAHCLRLIEQDGGYDEIHAVNRRGEGPGQGRIIWHAADLRNAMDAVRVIEAVRPTHLFHGAWMATPGVYLSSPENRDWMQASIALVRAFASRVGNVSLGLAAAPNTPPRMCLARRTTRHCSQPPYMESARSHCGTPCKLWRDITRCKLHGDVFSCLTDQAMRRRG